MEPQMRYSGYRRRLDALLDKLQPRGGVIRIEGGLPEPNDAPAPVETTIDAIDGAPPKPEPSVAKSVEERGLIYPAPSAAKVSPPKRFEDKSPEERAAAEALACARRRGKSGVMGR
jgi:hypothetical protein